MEKFAGSEALSIRDVPSHRKTEEREHVFWMMIWDTVVARAGSGRHIVRWPCGVACIQLRGGGCFGFWYCSCLGVWVHARGGESARVKQRRRFVLRTRPRGFEQGREEGWGEDLEDGSLLDDDMVAPILGGIIGGSRVGAR